MNLRSHMMLLAVAALATLVAATAAAELAVGAERGGWGGGAVWAPGPVVPSPEPPGEKEDKRDDRMPDGTPLPEVLSPEPWSQTVTDQPTFEVSGTAVPGDQVHIEVGHAVYRHISPVTAHADAHGDWSAHIPLGGGENSLRVYLGGYDLDPTAGFVQLYVTRGFFLPEPEGPIDFSHTVGPVSLPDKATVTSTINVPHEGTVGDMKLYTSLTHSYAPELKVWLYAPDDSWIRLKYLTHPLLEEYTTSTSPSLSPMIGKSAEGEWKMVIEDPLTGDIGTLNHWRLEMTVDPPSVPLGPIPVKQVVPLSHAPWADISDGWTGAGSAETRAVGGTVEGVALRMDISRQAPDDVMTVRIVSPDGSHGGCNVFGSGTDKLTAENCRGLSNFEGGPVDGEWTLAARSLSGPFTLKGWWLDVTTSNPAEPPARIAGHW